MRWKTKDKQLSAIGNKRRSVKFALFPIHTSDGMTIWMEKYLSVELFSDLVFRSIDPAWENIESWSQSSTMWSEWHEKI